jgi:hypothetical protein
MQAIAQKYKQMGMLRKELFYRKCFDITLAPSHPVRYHLNGAEFE